VFGYSSSAATLHIICPGLVEHLEAAKKALAEEQIAR
jgi:type IV secretory pathway VirB10-like protein